MALTIKEGKYYRTRDGRKVGPMVQNYDGEYADTHPWRDGSGYMTFRDNGGYNDDRRFTSPDDIIAEWADEPETQPETGTLAELNVKPGDVVECIEVKSKHTVLCVEKITHGMFIGQVRADLSDYGYGVFDEEKFRIVSRASKPNAAQAQADTQKLWRDMTPEEKGALLLAHHEGKVIEIWDLNQWLECDPLWADEYAYRIRPEPKRETVTLFAGKGANGGILQEIGTIDLIDGKPDPASIRMEEI